jgi:hypothetical protein
MSHIILFYSNSHHLTKGIQKLCFTVWEQPTVDRALANHKLATNHARQRVTTIRRATCFLLAQTQGYIRRHSDRNNHQEVRETVRRLFQRSYKKRPE